MTDHARRSRADVHAGTSAATSRAPGGHDVRLTIWTIGHSTRALSAFIDTLDAYDIQAVADVRRHPGSRRLPQFESTALERSLSSSGIAYRWLPALGGRRRPMSDSPNTAWRHPSFRAYADHIATDEFAEGLQELLGIAYGLRTTVMCAEVLWWRCHRRLIADVLTALGVEVMHIRDERTVEPHRLAPPATLVHGRLVYRQSDDDLEA